MFKFQIFSPHRLVFEKPAEQSEGLPNNDLAGFTFQFSKNISDNLMGDNGGEGNETTNNVQDINGLKSDVNKIIQENKLGVFRTGSVDGEYLIISGRDGETIGKINTVMMNGIPSVEATQYIPIYTPDLKSYTYEEKKTYYKTAANFKADLSIFTEDLRAN